MSSKGFLFTVLFVAGLIACWMFGYPHYRVWSVEQRGRAEFAEAEQNRKIRIENGSLTPTYIQYLWVRQQSSLNDKTVVYIPTETNLPVLEASRNKQPASHE